MTESWASPVPKPLDNILRIFAATFLGLTGLAVHFFEKKYVTSTDDCKRAPSTVARAAPNIPIPIGKTKNQSPNIFVAAPARLAARTRFGAPSFLMNPASRGESTNNGNAPIISPPYSRA